ncbi:MAG: carbon-nitrogen hydrolase family protein [Deltaproteobacteria bacterium]|nr:carbon-nitrogen hydrolase family protein [Deltaproteobacteria bacterium]
MKLRVALAQMNIVQFQPEANLKTARAFVEEAVRLNANLIVFPEVFLTGPLMGHLEYADKNSELIGEIKQMAKTWKIDIVAGSIIEKEGRKFFNVCYYVDFKGNLKARYKKIHLWNTEARYLSAGDRVSVFPTRFGIVGIGICWDLAFPEFFRALKLSGARIVFVPSYWSFGYPEHDFSLSRKVMRSFVDSLCLARAFENEIVLVYCNAAGELRYGEGTRETLVGHSQVTAPILGVFKKLNHNRAALCVVEANLKITDRAEKVYKIMDLYNRSKFVAN